MSDPKESARLAFESRERERRAAVTVTKEPRTYGPDNPNNSYYLDLAASALINNPQSLEAQGRLLRHAAEVAAEAETGGYEKRALHEVHRGGEFRTGLTTAAGSGGAYVSPKWLVEDWAAYRSPNNSFFSLTTRFPSPEYGASVVIPSFTGTASVTQQTEGGAVAEVDPTGLQISAPLISLTGQVTVSQQLWDRGGMPGLAVDAIVHQQLMEQYTATQDAYVIGQVLSSAASVSASVTFSASVFYNSLGLAAEQLADTAGVALQATHMFSATDFSNYVFRWSDTSGRPLLQPQTLLMPEPLDLTDEAWTGVHMLGQLRWFKDDNIPDNASNQYQILVCRPSEVFTFDGPPTPYAYPETNAENLQVVIGLRGYTAVINRFPKSVAVISGATYPNSLV